MRILGLLGLVAALVVVGLLVKQQLRSTRAPVVPVLAAPGASAPAPAGTVREQSRQIQQQYQDALDVAMKAQPRDLPDEAK